MNTRDVIDWDFWRMRQFVKEWEAAALSLGINPDALKQHPQGWMAGTERPVFVSESFAGPDEETKFDRRRRLAEDFGKGHWLYSLRYSNHQEINLSEFAAWLMAGGQTVPTELEPLGRTTPIPPTLSEVARPKPAPVELQIPDDLRRTLAQNLQKLLKAGGPAPSGTVMPCAPRQESPLAANEMRKRPTLNSTAEIATSNGQGANSPIEKKPGPKPGKAKEMLRNIVEALKEYAVQAKIDFDPLAAPGPLGRNWHEDGSLHWFCAQLDKAFRKDKTTFEKHRTGILAVKPYAKASDFYRRALPQIAPKFGVSPTANSMHYRANKTM